MVVHDRYNDGLVSYHRRSLRQVVSLCGAYLVSWVYQRSNFQVDMGLVTGQSDLKSETSVILLCMWLTLTSGTEQAALVIMMGFPQQR